MVKLNEQLEWITLEARIYSVFGARESRGFDDYSAKTSSGRLASEARGGGEVFS